jgi:hypothetical protein
VSVDLVLPAKAGIPLPFDQLAAAEEIAGNRQE